ncbi:MAG: acyl-CoA dehydrogenase family protein [Acidimicrobiia bacterium]
MDFLPDDEQLALTRSAVDLLGKRLGDLRDIALAPWSARALLRECAQLGWLGLGVAEDAGGSGATVVEEALLFRELGRALAPGPFLATVLAGRVALAGGDNALAEQIINGEVMVALAEPSSSAEPGAPLGPNGTSTHRVFDGHDCDLLLLIDAASAHLVAPPPMSLVPCIDETTTLASASLSASSVRASTRHSEPILRVGQVLVSAMLTGIAEATRDMAVEYLNDRQQFGRPIGSFQGLKHQAADMAVEAEVAASITNYAALALAEGHENAVHYCLSARILTHRAALANARTNVQHHGAMGCTFEHDAHFYVKRTHVLGHLLGGVHAPLVDLFEQPSPFQTGSTP